MARLQRTRWCVNSPSEFALAQRLHTTRDFKQVIASLLVSVLIIGLKLGALKELSQTWQRRSELKANLALLTGPREAEELAAWLSDIAHDTAQRQARILSIESASGSIYSEFEKKMIEDGVGKFAVFEGISASTTHLALSKSIRRMQTKQDGATGLMLGLVETEIRAPAKAIIAYILNVDGRHFQSSVAANANMKRLESLESINGHHEVVFVRFGLPGIKLHRTFLNSFVAKCVADDPPTYVVAVVPVGQHPKIGPKDEAGAIRAENHRIFRLTEETRDRTKLEYVCALDLRGSIPRIVTNKVAIPAQLMVPQSMQRYFQQVRPLETCDADDGRIVALMIRDLAGKKPTQLDSAIPAFASRNTMLRACGFPHIGAMLVALLTADTESDVEHIPVAEQAALLTKEQATAIGRMLASNLMRSAAPSSALQKAVNLHPALRTMKAQHVWFVPMLEVLAEVHARVSDRPTIVRRLSTLTNRVQPEETIAAFITVSDSSFDPVVRPREE